MEKETLNRYVEPYVEFLSINSLKMLEGLSSGSQIPFESILNFNGLDDLIFSKGCSTLTAVGKATAEGGTVVLKTEIYCIIKIKIT